MSLDSTARRDAELGAAGTALLADKTEQLRADWVGDRMVDARARPRARALGWPDAYAFTKSLGENALARCREASCRSPSSGPRSSSRRSPRPRPGWIRGFRMAEPVIISYARGLLRQFPGVPEGIVDVIPVDLVVAALIAVAAAGSRPSRPTASTRSPRASGTRCATAQLVDLIRGVVHRATRSTTTVASRSSSRSGRFPAVVGSRASCAGPSGGLGAAERLVNALPLRGERAERAPVIEERRAQAERALGYVELYGAYSETEARFRIDSTLALFESLDADRPGQAFCFDPAVDRVAPLRRGRPPALGGRARPGPHTRRGQANDGEPRGALLEGDPVRPSPAVPRSTSRTPSSPPTSSSATPGSRPATSSRRARPARRRALLPKGPKLLRLDRRDRSDFLRSFYRRYEGAPVDQLRVDAWELFSDCSWLRAFPEAIARVRRTDALGHRTLLITARSTSSSSRCGRCSTRSSARALG